jgi:threonine/homoserine/homoserine lactone efflux protein
MPDWSTFLIFSGAAILLLVVPGPAVLYIVARSIDQGRIAGVVSTVGIGVGTLIHVGAASLGLSALLVSSALAFSVVKYLGAAYLLYLGVRTLLSRNEVRKDEPSRPQSLSQIFYQGILVNLLNPKTALFFFAFLPQFVDPSAGSVAGQILFLGAWLVILGIVSDGAYAIMAGTLGDWLKNNVRVLRAQKYFAGTVYILLGLATALSGSNRK